MEKNLTFLLIDDDPDDTELFIASAKEVDENIHCLALDSGQKALDYLNDDSNVLPEYIFLDLRMPKISGQKCLEEIKKVPRLADIPVFVYTTSSDKNDIENLEKLGAVMFISKPTNPEEIYYLLSTIVGEKWSEMNKGV